MVFVPLYCIYTVVNTALHSCIFSVVQYVLLVVQHGQNTAVITTVSLSEALGTTVNRLGFSPRKPRAKPYTHADPSFCWLHFSSPE